MAERREYRLKIEAYSPETMPMKRLAEYLGDMAVLLGEENSVHLIAIESSSTCPVVLVDWEAEPKVFDRLIQVRDNEGPEEAQRAYRNFDERLKKDNASANLIGPSRATIMEFPGATRPKPIEWPSINQASELYGVPIWVGGRAELSNVDLLDQDTEWKCLAERAKAISIARHIYVTTLRVFGRGRWRKSPDGPWVLERFVIEDFETMKPANVEQAIQELRKVKARWKLLADPVAALTALRRGDDGENENTDGGI